MYTYLSHIYEPVLNWPEFWELELLGIQSTEESVQDVFTQMVQFKRNKIGTSSVQERPI